jgi:hypothetical protein
MASSINQPHFTPLIFSPQAAGNAGACDNLGLVKLTATKNTAPGRSLRIQVALRDEQTLVAAKGAKGAREPKSKSATTTPDCQGLLVSVTLPAGVTYQPGKNPHHQSKASPYNATVADGVLSWRGPALARGKARKFDGTFVVASSGVTGPLYFTATAQCLNANGVPTCTMPMTTAKVNNSMRGLTGVTPDERNRTRPPPPVFLKIHTSFLLNDRRTSRAPSIKRAKTLPAPSSGGVSIKDRLSPFWLVGLLPLCVLLRED